MNNNMKQELPNHVIKPKVSFHYEDEEYRLISEETEKELDISIIEIENFMANHSGYGESEQVKDELYLKAQEAWNRYASLLREVVYTFYLNKKQFAFLTSLLKEKLEYDVNTIFLAIELTNMLGTWIKSEKKSIKDELKGFQSDATEITYIYHLIAKHKVKGLGGDSYIFAEILRKIGEISKVINYYDTSAKNLSADIQTWVAGFEPQETQENSLETVESQPSPETNGKVKKPKKTK